MTRLATVLTLALAVVVFVGCSSCPQPYGASDGLGNECGQPVYQGPHCLKIHPKVEKFMSDLHEKIFDCEPDPPAAYSACPPAPCK